MRPDSIEFAKTVLACLADLRSELWIVRKQLEATTEKQFLDHLEKTAEEVKAAVYLEMLNDCGLKSDPPSPDRGADPRV